MEASPWGCISDYRKHPCVANIYAHNMHTPHNLIFGPPVVVAQAHSRNSVTLLAHLMIFVLVAFLLQLYWGTRRRTKHQDVFFVGFDKIDQCSHVYHGRKPTNTVKF